MNIQPSTDKDNKPCLLIPTLEGEMICSLGDYLIKEPFPTDWRKIYPCKKEIFSKTYRENNIEMYLNTNLKIFEFDDGEQHWIVAKNKKDAIKWYENEYSEAYKDDGYEVKEVLKDTKREICIVEDEELLKIVNKYKNITIEQTEHIPIWLYLKYLITEAELQGRKFRVPNIIASSVY